MMRIANNISGLNTVNSLKQGEKTRANAMARLSSGHRINRAADDAAGLFISENGKYNIDGDEVAYAT